MAHCPHCECGIGNRDDFGANDGRPHAGWTYDNFFGTTALKRPTNTGGKFFFELPAIEIFDAANPDGVTGAVHARALVKLHEKTAGSGDMAGIIVGWLNATTFLHVSLSYHSETADPGGCDYLQFWACDAIAGGRYIYARLPIRGMTLDQDHELHVCLKPDTYYITGDTVRAHVKLADGTYWGRQAYATGYDGSGFTGGAQAGLITSSNSGTDNQAYFDDWAYEHFKDSDAYRCCHNCNTPCFIFDDTLEHGDLEAGGTLVGDEVYNTAYIQPFYPLTCFWGVLSGTARFADTTVIQWLEIESGGRVMCRVPHPQGKTAKIVIVDFYWESGVVIRIDLGTGYVLFTPSSGTMKLYDNDSNLLGGVSDLPDAPGGQFTCRVCYHDGALTCSLTGAGVPANTGFDASSPDTGDVHVYLGSDMGTAHFRNFRFEKHKDTAEPEDRKCDRCIESITCTDACKDGQAPNLFKLFTLDVGCAILGTNPLGTHIVRNRTDSLRPCLEACEWFTVVGSFSHWTVDVIPPIGACPTTAGKYRVQVSAQYGINNAVWQKDYDGRPDCINFSDEEIPLVSNDGACPLESVFLTAI